MTITDELNGPGSGSIRLKPSTPYGITARLVRSAASWIVVTSTHPGEGMVINREVLGDLSGGHPVGGLVDRVTADLSVSLTGWSSILTGPGALDIGYHDGWWDSDGARGLGWWLERICGRSLDTTPDISHDTAEGRWLDAGSLLPSITREMATTGGWRSRIDGLNLAASVLGFVWWTELVGGRPCILVDHSNSAPDVTLSWLISTVLSPGTWGECDADLFGTPFTTTVRTLAATQLDREIYVDGADSATAIVGDGKTGNTDEQIGTASVLDVDGEQMHRWVLTSVQEGDTSGETDDNLAAALVDGIVAKGSSMTATMPAGTLIEHLPPLNGAVAVHDPATGADFGATGIDAASVPRMAVGPNMVGTVPVVRCLRRTIPITDGMGVWHVDMRTTDQTVTDLTPHVVMESGAPSIELGDPPRPDVRDRILGARGGTTIVA